MQPIDLSQAIKIAELLSTRLCHDLTGPIGAVNNGAEFLKEEGSDLQGQANELIMSSAAEAVNRLQFYRRTYGRINDDGEASLTDHQQLCEEFFKGSKISLDWPGMHTDASGISISRKMGRVLLNLVMVASLALIRGGTVQVRVSQTDDEKQVMLTGQGQSIKWDKDLDLVFGGKMQVADLTPKTVQPFLLAQLAAEIGARLAWTVTDAEVMLTVTQKHTS